MKKLRFISGLLIVALTGCAENVPKPVPAKTVAKDTVAKTPVDTTKAFRGKTVPVLCYHAIRQSLKSDSAEQKAYSVSPENFAMQMKTLADSGYQSVTPDQVRDYYTKGVALPEKPIVISFDDGRKDQFTIAAVEMEKHNLRGVFYIMTVSLGKKNYMSRDDVRALADKGHIIGLHTWDHQMVTKYKTADDWNLQITKPRKMLEGLTQKPVTSFAYPYGVWNIAATDSLKSRGFTTAFIFFGKQDPSRPMYTLERINGPDTGNMEKFMKRIGG